MAKRTILIVIISAIVIGLGVELNHIYRLHYDVEPVADEVSSSASQTSNNTLHVGNSTATSGTAQAGGGSLDVGDTTGTVAQLTDPSTFSQYNTPKYENGNSASYIDLQTGTGATLSTAGQKAVITYKGWLTNGTLFDETKVNAQGQTEAFEFTYKANPGQVIPGFDEGVSGMKVGGTRLLIIPPAAGYGSTVSGPIPANSVLVFEIQLIEIQ